MFRGIPGNDPDIKIVQDLMCRRDEIGIVKEAAAVLGRSYACVENLGELSDMNFKSVVEQTCWANS